MRAAMALVSGLVLALSWPARADEDLNKSMAKRHYENGAQYYQTASYEAALEEFEKAYRLVPKPALLFNIGRCYEALGKLEKAVTHYEEYLQKVPDARDRPTLEERIKNIRKRIEERPPPAEKEKAAAPSPVAAPPPEETTAMPPELTDTSPTVAEQPRDPARTWKIAGWTAIGVGGAALVTAGILGGLALAKTGEYEEAHQKHETYAEAKKLLDSAEGLERGCFIALGVGLAAAAAGTLILVLKGRPAQADDSAWQIRPDAAGLAVQF